MDYTSDESLLFADWKQINDPAFKVGIFQGQSEGEFARYVITPDFRIVDIPISNSISYDNYNLNIPPGTCPGFVITKTTNNTKVYYTWNNEHKYYQNINDPSDYKSFSTIQHPDDETLVFLFYNYDNCPKSSGAYLELSFSKIKNKYQSAKGLIAIIQEHRSKAKVLPCANANASKKIDDNINGVALNCTAENIKEFLKEEIEAINAITSNSTAKEINKALQTSFYNCVYANIDIDKRITILDKLLKEDVDDSLWEFEKGLFSSDDIFFLDNLILSTPEKDRVKLLKDGFMKNNSEWLRVIFDKAKGSNIANNDVTLRKDVIPLFTSLSSWVSQYYNELGIQPTMTGIITNFPNLEIYQYPIASVKPVLLTTSTDKELFKIGEYINGAIYDYRIHSAYSVNFKKDDKITFRYDINKEVVSTQFSTPGKSPATIYENYILTVYPFEPVIIKAPRNYLSLQIKENEEYIVPAFLAAAYQQAIIDDKNSEIIHSLSDKALMASAVATSLFTGGSSYGAYLTYVAGIAAAGNDLIREERKNLDKDEAYREKYASYYEAWDSFYSAVQIAAVADAAYTLANNISKVNFINKTQSFYTKMKTFDFEGKLKSTWESLSGGKKINEVAVITSRTKWIDELENLIGNGAKQKINEWINKGLDKNKLEKSFIEHTNKEAFFRELEKAKSINHQKVIIGDYESISGITKGEYISNSVDNVKDNVIIKVHKNDFILKKFQAETFAKNSRLIERKEIDVIEDLGNGIQFVRIKPGTKLYRVFDGYKPWDDISQTGNTLPKGNYWTFDKPTSISEVIEGTAVMPEWNGMTKIIEIEVPSQGIYVWRGIAARQPASSKTKDFFLKGGTEQLIFDYKQNGINLSKITKSIKELK